MCRRPFSPSTAIAILLSISTLALCSIIDTADQNDTNDRDKALQLKIRNDANKRSRRQSPSDVMDPGVFVLPRDGSNGDRPGEIPSVQTTSSTNPEGGDTPTMLPRRPATTTDDLVTEIAVTAFRPRRRTSTLPAPKKRTTTESPFTTDELTTKPARAIVITRRPTTTPTTPTLTQKPTPKIIYVYDGEEETTRRRRRTTTRRRTPRTTTPNDDFTDDYETTRAARTTSVNSPTFQTVYIPYFVTPAQEPQSNSNAQVQPATKKEWLIGKSDISRLGAGVIVFVVAISLFAIFILTQYCGSGAGSIVGYVAAGIGELLFLVGIGVMIN